MPELNIRRTGSNLMLRLGEYSTNIPFADVALHINTREHIYKDAAAYGRALFDNAFRDEQLCAYLSTLPAKERLVLVADDPSVTAIPWEYLRDQNGKLLASRLNFLRGIPESERRDSFTFAPPLEIIAIPVSPIDEKRELNGEREWKDLVQAVTNGAPTKALTVKRVRPPTISNMASLLNRRATSIVHFMGHSASRDGKAWLVFEDTRASSHLVDAADFDDALNQNVLLVVLSSCLTAAVTTTEFSSIARSLVHFGLPYALGTQFFLSDEAALVLSQTLYTSLLQGASVEEAVTHVRRGLEEPGRLPNPAWLAGIPVFYTSLPEPLTKPLTLSAGRPIIVPDPEQLQQTCDLTAIPSTEYFVGRSHEICQALDALLVPHVRGFVLLHGLGGIGKTATARVIAERVSYYYQDRVLALSFETFASLNGTGKFTINEQFADRFYNRLARFHGLDPARYSSTIDLQQAILQYRTHQRSLLVLDNIETLIDAQKRDLPAYIELASFIARLKEGEGAILLTSRVIPPADWGDCEVISVSGLSDEAGADLFLALLPTDRELLASPAARVALSQRVQGHPLSIRLLAGRFADVSATDLATFLQQLEEELEAAEQQTPSSLEDPERHRTLYACMDYSVKRLSPEQRKVLDAVGLFLAPFLPESATFILDDEEQTPVLLQSLVHLGLLTATTRTFQEGELLLLELHPMLRWYIQHHLPATDKTLQERYGEVYRQLARQSYQLQGGYDQSALMRYLVRQSLPDFEAALQYLPPAERSNLAYYLAESYMRLGQNRRALALYEQALEIDQQIGNVRGVAVTQNAMADVLRQLGKPHEALTLHEQALRTSRELGDLRSVAVTQNAMADVLSQLGKPQEALTLYEQSLRIKKKLGDVRGVAVTQSAMADVLSQLGKPQEALTLYEQALLSKQELGDVRSVAVTQSAMADVLSQQGKPQEALALYEQALRIKQELGDVRSVAVTQHAMADVLSQQGRPQEALALYEQALRTTQELGDVREVAVTQHAMAIVLRQQGKPQEALALYEQALRTMQELGDVREVATTQYAMADVLRQQGKPQEALALYERVLLVYQELGDVRSVAVTQHAMADVLRQQGKPQEALALYERVLLVYQELGDVRGVAATQSAMADVLRQQGKPQEALALYEQALRTTQELGDVRGVAATQVNFGQLLLQQGEVQPALTMIWQAYISLQQHGYTYDAQTVQKILASIKRQVLGPEEFDHIWTQVFQEAQPDWLASVEAVSDGEEQGRISLAQLDVIIANTVTVMTDMPEKRDEWREAMEGALQQARSIEQAAEAEFFSAALSILDGQEPSLPEGHPYTAELEKIRSGIKASGLQEKDNTGGVSAEVMQAVRDFVGAKDWEVTRQVVESQQALLFRPEVEALFELNITQARTGGDERAVRLLEMHLAILRACQDSSIEEAFSKLTAAEEEGDEAEEEEAVDLPFDTKLISRSVEALLSKRPQEKMAHMQYLANLENETTDEELQQLLNTIKLALFSQDFSQLGRDLRGVYRQAWGTIAATVEAGGVDPQLFAMIASNTLAVLGPAAGQRSIWRSNLAEMRNQATAKGDRHMAALLNAVIGLLDAGGDSVGLGEGLQGIYARTWQAIVQGLPK